MPAELTEAEFSKHLNTRFQVQRAENSQVDLELDQVKPYSSRHNEHEGMERFSAFFVGPAEPLLPQMTYAVKHEQMGEFELFLVPVARIEQGFRYEAVFNYFRQI
jgi:uncharacterized protein DUF6916